MSGVNVLLHELGFTCTRPTYISLLRLIQLSKKNLKKWKTLKDDLLNGKVDRILFQDESMIRDYQAIARTWFPKGQQRIIPTYGKHQVNF